jgi:hypothetical protein
MPADTLKLPGGGKVNRKVVLAAGAVGVGVVGYAWWTRGGGAGEVPEEVVTEDELDAVGDERIPTTGVPYDPTTPAPAGGINTNAEWTQFATDRLLSLGYDPVAVGDAIGLFFDRKPLPPAQANLVRAALGQAGQPPVGGPWVVIEQQAPASVGMTAPILARSAPVYRNGAWEYVISWAPVPGATRYWFQHVGGSSGYITDTKTTTIRAGASRVDTWKFAGVNAANVKGPEATISTTLAPAPATAPRPTPSVRVPTARITATGRAGRGFADISWNRPLGATQFRIRRETGNTVTAWVNIGNRLSIRQRALVRVPTYYAWRVQAGNSAGWGSHDSTGGLRILP